MQLVQEVLCCEVEENCYAENVLELSENEGAENVVELSENEDVLC